MAVPTSSARAHRLPLLSSCPDLFRASTWMAGSSPAMTEQGADWSRFGDGVFVIIILRCYFAAATVANGIFSVPGGSSGVNTASSIRGAKSQSLNTAVNCGCEGWFL
jgi:hypothetical protein